MSSPPAKRRSSRAELRAAREGLQAAKDEVLVEVLDGFVPDVVAQLQRVLALGEGISGALEEAIVGRDWDGVRALVPAMKLLQAENKGLLDRRFGSSVQRREEKSEAVVDVKVEQRVVYTSLRELLQQANAQGGVVEGGVVG